MKVNRKKLAQDIEDVIANGVFENEEVDTTTEKVMKVIEELIIAVEHEKGS